MSLSSTVYLPFWSRITPLLLLLLHSSALNNDGVLLLSFKYSILSDPFSVLESWNYHDETPCAWNGIACTEIGSPGTPDMFRVTSLVLPNSQLQGSVSSDLGMIQYLHHLDLSNNSLNGSLPLSLFNGSKLQVLSLSNNEISGELPEAIGELRSLQFLNLSDNALAGNVPENLTALSNLSVVSLRSNYFSGHVPRGFNFVEVLDLSSNLLNGSLPLDFGGGSIRYLNLSYNNLSGTISSEFAKGIPENATIDVSFNNLTGAIPESLSLLNQKTDSFSGNLNLCGKPLKILCSIPSTLATPPPNITSPPAIAAIPKTIDSTPVTNSTGTSPNETQKQGQGGLKPGTIAVIAVGDVAGIGILATIFFYVYQIKKKRRNLLTNPSVNKDHDSHLNKVQATSQSPEPKSLPSCSCLTIKGEEASEVTGSDTDDQDDKKEVLNVHDNNNYKKGGTLVTVDGETKLELETLLKATAYILGANGRSIVYKAVLEDGTAFAVRRIGENGIERLREFESQVRLIAKLRHPNLVRVRGFYWGADEKLVIYDYVPNGSLASATNKKMGLSSYHLTLDIRLKIATGAARGLSYVHEKKHVHGNIKPSNILLTSDMDPMISDFGLDRLVCSDNSHKADNSARHFGSKRSSSSLQDLPTGGGSPYGSAGPPLASTSPYHAPESLKNFKPNPKWDVYSFGIVLLELLSGKAFSDWELVQWAPGSVSDDENRVLRLTDVAVRAEVEGREEAMLECFKLGFSCASLTPQKRPSMKEALQVLEKISSPSHY